MNTSKSSNATSLPVTIALTALFFPSLTSIGCVPVGQPSDWPFAVVNPAVVLRYRDSASTPKECKDPNKMLERIQDDILASPEPRCTTELQSPVGASEVLKMVCPLPSDVVGCDLHYFGTLWSERDPASPNDYDLRGVGWLSSTCRNGRTYQVDADVRDRVTSQGAGTIQKIVKQCRTENET